MTETVHDALASHPVETAVRRRLHDVRPHEVHEVEFDGQRAICKVKRHPTGEPALEARLLEFVGRETSVPVPEVLTVGENHFVAAWCPDLPDEPTVDRARLRAMGTCLARLHADAADHFDGPGRLVLDEGRTAAEDGPELPVEGDDRWSDTLCAFLEDRRQFLAPRGYGDLAEEVRAFVEEFRWAYDGVGEPTLLHGNVLPEHVGIERTGDGATVSRLIDFEHALVGPPAFDLLRSLGPLFGPPSHGATSADRAAFLDGYRSVRPLPQDLDAHLRRHEVVNAVSYVRSLHLQRGDRDSRHSVARRARGLERHTRERMAELRSELEAE